MSAPELSSIGSSLDELGRRVTALAEQAAGTDRDWVAQDLLEVERSLDRARRRLAACLDRLSEPGANRPGRRRD